MEKLYFYGHNDMIRAIFGPSFLIECCWMSATAGETWFECDDWGPKIVTIEGPTVSSLIGAAATHRQRSRQPKTNQTNQPTNQPNQSHSSTVQTNLLNKLFSYSTKHNNTPCTGSAVHPGKLQYYLHNTL